MSNSKKKNELWVCWVDGEADAFVGTEKAARNMAAKWADGGAHPVSIGKITVKVECRVTFIEVADDE